MKRPNARHKNLKKGKIGQYMLKDIIQVKMRIGKPKKIIEDSALQQRVECMLAINSKLHRIPFHKQKVKLVSAISAINMLYTTKDIVMKDFRNTAYTQRR